MKIYKIFIMLNTNNFHGNVLVCLKKLKLKS